MTPYQRRRLKLWLNPLRFLCEMGFHRDDGVIHGTLRHCGRCCGPWRLSP